MFNPDHLRHTLESLRQAWQSPGLAVAILNADDILFAEGFGYRDLAKQAPVTPQTLFAIGSVTKAFVATGAGLLVDAGCLAWDTPIREYLPWFKLHDSFASERLTLRDLLTHRSGLPRHEKSWWNAPFSRRELIERLRYLPPSADLRSKFQYQNIMYVTAGYLVGEVAESSWEAFTQTQLLDPLGMSNTNFSADVMQKNPDFALPYIQRNGQIEGIPFYDNDEMGPAGSINSNLFDLAKWLQFQLNKGKIGATSLIAPETLASIHTPQITISSSEFPSILGEDFLTYGMGWFIGTYQGHTRYWHTGGIDGFTTSVSFIPSANLGVIVYANLNESPLPGVVMYSLLDTLLGIPDRDWHTRIKNLVEQGDNTTAQARAISAAQQVPNTKPSHPLADYIGEYEHAGYGSLYIEQAADGLQMRLHGVISPLTHYHYDIFELYNEMYEDNKWIKLNFHSDLAGQISGVSLRIELALDEPLYFAKR